MARPEEFDLAAEETPMTDDEIQEAVETLFASDERVDPTYIEVSVENGIVRLEGSVGTQQEKEMADSLLDDIEGIQAVENNLQVILAGYTPDEAAIAEGKIILSEAVVSEEGEFEDVEPLPADEDLVTEDVMDAIDEGKSYVPPNEPIFPTERGEAAERMRQRVAEKEATGDAPDKL